MQIIMPKLGLTMTHGTITEWLKGPGDPVRAEEALCVYETEKVTLELPAPEDGVLAEILVPAGTTVPVGTPVCEFRTKSEERGRGTGDRGQEAGDRGQEAGDRGQEAGGRGQEAGDRRQGTGGRGQGTGDSTEYAIRSTEHASPTSAPATQAVQPLTATPKARVLARQLSLDLARVVGSGPGGRIQARDVEAARAGAGPAPVKATPLARRMAAAEGIDLSSIIGSGPEGAITREDVERAVRGQEAGVRGQEAGDRGQEAGVRGQEAGVSTEYAIRGAEYAPPTSSLQPLTSLRRTIAERMTQSAFTAPHVTLFTEAEATNLVSARAQLNEELNLSSTTGADRAGARISYNALLAALVARALREHPNLNARWEPDGIHLLADINIALAVDTERGLMTPVLRNVDRLSLAAIQAGFTELVNRALAGKSLPDDFVGGTFTITNLGALDVDGFTPIINPPQAAILGVGRIVEKPVARDGAVVIRPMMVLSLSFDHRIVDGGPAARFLQRVKQLVERPIALLLG